MKNKGLILFFTILLALVCLYCLSFTFATWRVERNADKYANDPVAIENVKTLANGDVMLEKHLVDSLVEARTRQYLTNKNDSSVFLGTTYKKCKYKELNLGLDLKGGMNVTLEISMPDVVQSLASNKEDELSELPSRMPRRSSPERPTVISLIFLSIISTSRRAR